MSEEKKKLTELSELGEFGLIDRLTKNNRIKNTSTIKGIGDDAAVLDYKDKMVVVTTDLLVEGIHFDLVYTPLRHLGYKAVVVNLSDIYAMNAHPRQVTVSIAVSRKFSVEALDEFYKGIYLACDRYIVDLVGGDTSTSLTGLMISVTAIGEAEKDKIVYRHTAKPNDLICVTGDLGGAYMGLQLLEREKLVYNSNPNMQPEFKGQDYILARQLKPEARKEIIELFEKNNILPTSMIDISDGLSSELIHICSKSETGCCIYEDKIPVAAKTQGMAEEFNMVPVTCALNGGEDYELLFTLPLSDFDRVKDLPDISIIGHITEKDAGMNLVTRNGSAIPLIAQGWNAMKDL